MAYICYRPKGSCPTCVHFRWDEENMRMSCWAQKDEEELRKKKLQDEEFQYHILQMPLDQPGCFRSYSEQKLPLRMDQYEEVYTGILPNNVREYSINATLEWLFAEFNWSSRPKGFSGHSLSVSDVVILNIDGVQKAFFCESVGFKEITLENGD